MEVSSSIKSAFWVNGVPKCNKLAVNFKLAVSMTFVVLYNYLNCTVDKIIDTRRSASTECNTNYRIILLMIILILFESRPT